MRRIALLALALLALTPTGAAAQWEVDGFLGVTVDGTEVGTPGTGGHVAYHFDDISVGASAVWANDDGKGENPDGTEYDHENQLFTKSVNIEIAFGAGEGKRVIVFFGDTARDSEDNAPLGSIDTGGIGVRFGDGEGHYFEPRLTFEPHGEADRRVVLELRLSP